MKMRIFIFFFNSQKGFLFCVLMIRVRCISFAEHLGFHALKTKFGKTRK